MKYSRFNDMARMEQMAELQGILVLPSHCEDPFLGMVRYAVSHYAAYCAFDLRHADGQIERIAVCKRCPATNELLATTPRQFLDATAHGPRAVIENCLPKYIPSLDSDALAAFVGRQGPDFQSLLSIPLRHHTTTLGALTFAFSTATADATLAEIERYGLLAATVVHNAQIHTDAESRLRTQHEFLSMAAHELKTPLAAIHGYIQLLNRLAKRKAVFSLQEHTVGAMAESAEKQCRRIIRFVNNLLDFSKITSRGVELELEQVELTGVVDETIDRVSAEMNFKTEFVQLNAPKEIFGMWDRFRIEQVITNLLSNAMKYGNGKSIEIRLKEYDESVTIEVEDNGIGIPPENQRRIFDCYERAVSGKQYAGVGLGLWIVRHIVEAHEGQISVRSSEGFGSTFSVTLPKKLSSASQKEIAC